MATTSTDLYRSVMGDGFKRIEIGIYPGDGVLYPRLDNRARAAVARQCEMAKR